MSKQVRLSELINATPKQNDFLQAIKKFKFTLYGGAAGGGKSYILRWALILFCIYCWTRYKVRVSVGLFCEDYPALRDRHIEKIKTEFPSWLGKLKDDGRVYELAPQFGGGTILLRNLDDPSKYDSVEFAAIAVDEIGKNPESVFHELRKRLRWPRVPGQPSLPEDFVLPFMAATNPGAAWVKRLWIDRDFPDYLADIADQFCYVPAKATDNPYNPPDYYAALKTLPPEMAKAYAEGSWDLFQGQFFDEWRRDLHVVEGFRIPEFWTRFTSTDWGYHDLCVTGWFAVSPEQEVYLYREYVINKKPPDEVARELLKISGSEPISYRKLDPTAWSQRANNNRSVQGPSVAEEFTNAGWPVGPGDNSRVIGWTQLHKHLYWAVDEAGNITRFPKLKIFNTCSYIIRSVPALKTHPHKADDIADNQDDHGADMVRMGLMTRPPLSIEPLDQLDPDMQAAFRRAMKEYEERR